VTGTPWLWTAWTRNLLDLPALVQGLTCNGVPAEFVKESLVPRTPASVKPVDGWTAQLITCGLPKPVEVQGATVTGAPTSAVWTADDAHQIGQNEFQMFTISVGRLPAAGTTRVLPAAQGYTDGTTLNWADTETAAHDHSAATPSAAASAAPVAAVSSSDGGDTAGRVGLAAGLIGRATGASVLARSRPARNN
jgi:hypothetical protein